MPAFEYEFFGPVGTSICTVLVPAVLYALTAASNSDGCLTLAPWDFPGWPWQIQLFSWTGVSVAVAWFLWHIGLHAVLPAQLRKGTVEPDGRQWTYRLNGFRCFVITYGLIFVLTFVTRTLQLSWAADHFVELMTGALIVAVSLSITLYLRSFAEGTILAKSGVSGCPPYDFWMGRELNPRVFGIDLKEFCELYPGLIAWAVLNLAFAHKQLEVTGQVSLPMVLINIFQLVYVIDALWMEPSILTTMDITTEGFGYMLAVGDLAWVPFVYCAQAKFLAENAPPLPLWLAATSSALNILGYVMFRGANGQKDQFRRDPSHPSVRHLQALQTKRGTKLITSGWWGVARHPNYTGDWLMGLAWCMLCGYQCAVPYFYALYFAVLLLHRERRDDHACEQKYGSDWDEYRRRVRWRLIPRVY